MKKPPSGFRFYASLLRLSRIYPHDPPTQHLVFELLGLCKRWDDAIDYKDDILRVLQYGFSLAGHHSLEHPDSPLQKLPYVLTDTSGDELFLHIFPTIYSLHTTDGSAGTSFLLTVPQFIRNRILCSDPSKSPHSTITLGYQIFLALVIILNQLNEEDTFALTFFLSSMLRDAELQWSPYLPSNSIEEIVQSYRDLLNQANNFHYFDYQERVVRKRINIIIREHNSKNSWRGDWTMLLWKSACKTFHQGRLPDDWNDAAFFNESIVDMMIQYYRHMKQQQYVGMDRDTLRSYFETALGKGWQPGGDDGQLSVPRHSGEDQHQDLRESVEDGSISKAIFEGEEIDIVQSSGNEGAAPDESRRAEERYRAVQEILNELDDQSRRT
ncbi:hypothetical protein FRC03_002881 [Tulasnella sp. 419]|nr:hypothetical protein FRC03_002881 [Tulasnella sp. 419]